MSTRCQIRFVDKFNDISQIYQHSDGYPDSKNGVIQNLKDFFDWYYNEPMGKSGDSSYAAADYIYFMKKKFYGSKEMSDNGYDKLGFGVENVGKIHGDEEYLYIVDMSDAKTPNEIKIYISSDFNEKSGFNTKKWEFSGTLKNAYKKFVLTKPK